MRVNRHNIWSPDNNLDGTRRAIIKLNSNSINQIAAGEVVERPAAAVKELIENSLDAKANSIEIIFSNGGKSLIKVCDDGWGIPKEELKLAMESHATSKFLGDDLTNIQTFGFRGEALPSMGAVGNLTLRSKELNSEEAFELKVAGGKIEKLRPAALERGTTVELRDLFYVTPARLKFMRSDQSEARAIIDIVKRLSLANPAVDISLSELKPEYGAKKILKLSAVEDNRGQKKRIGDILGQEFIENSFSISEKTSNYSLSGCLAIPTLSKSSSVHQYFFVNGRPIKDYQLSSALKAAYFDFMSKDRHPMAVLFLECRPSLVDVNVHPMKSQVRFKNPQEIRNLIVSSVKKNMLESGLKANSVLGSKAASSFSSGYSIRSNSGVGKFERPNSQGEFLTGNDLSLAARVEEDINEKSFNVEHVSDSFRLGAAKAHIHENYIISQSKNGLVIVDQHAAHERLVYEILKASSIKQNGCCQMLLLPEVVEVAPEIQLVFEELFESLGKLGFDLESFGSGAICVRGIPAILSDSNPRNLINDLIDEVIELGTVESAEAKIDAIISRIACHGSVRSGKVLSGQEMNKLLRDMETSPNASQCNHGRPTFIELKLSDIEKLFGRS